MSFTEYPGEGTCSRVLVCKILYPRPSTLTGSHPERGRRRAGVRQQTSVFGVDTKSIYLTFPSELIMKSDESGKSADKNLPSSIEAIILRSPKLSRGLSQNA